MTIPKVNINELLDAGAHFGHRASRWNPKMAPYIYGTRDEIHIIDLRQTVPLMEMALKQIYETVKNHGKVLFVGSKVQASEMIAEYAESCGQYYVNHRWLGGMITNWETISKSIKKLDNIEKELEDEELMSSFTKKEILDINRKKDKLLKTFGGIRNIGSKPDLIIIIDTNKEHLAIDEAQTLNIPTIAIVDTNSNPDKITYPVPGNDDAIRSIKLYCKLFSEAALAGIADGLSAAGADIGGLAEINSADISDSGAIKKMDSSNKMTKNRTKTSKEKANDTSKNFEEKITDNIASVKSAVKKTAEKIEKKADEITKSTKEATHIIEEKVADAAHKVAEVANEVVQKVVDSVKKDDDK